MKTFFGFLLCLTLVLAFSNAGQARTWYLDSSAKGANNGTSWTDAWTSLGSIGNVAAGDTVYISGGASGASQTYPVPSGGWKPKGGSATAPVTYQSGQDAQHNGMAIIDGGGSQYLIKPSVGNWTLSGYVEGISGRPAVPSGDRAQLGGRLELANNWDAKVFLGAVNNNNNIKLQWIYSPSGTRFVRCENGANITGLEVTYCWHHKIPADSELANQSATLDDVIYLSGESEGGHFAHNYFEIPCSSPSLAYGDDGFKWPINDLIEANHLKMYIYAGWVSGDKNQHADMIQGNPRGIIIRQNWFESPTESVFAHYNRGGAGSFDKIYFYNNLISQSFSSEQVPVGRVIDFDPQPSGAWSFSDVLIANNTITNFRSTFPLYRFHAASAWTNCRIQNNAFFNCSNAISTDSSQIVQTANKTNPSSADFVSAAGGDWHLSSTSSLRGSGTDAPKTVFTTDFDGVTRTIPWDVGAYAYAAGGPPPSPSPTPAPTATPSPTATPTPTPPPPAVDVGDGVSIAAGFGLYPLNVTASGTYKLSALVTAPHSGANSVWIDFDSDPASDDTRCWDIPLATVPTSETVNWRGNGTPEAAQFAPQEWNLPAGTHQLYISKREPITIESVTFHLVPVGLPTPTPGPSPTPSVTPTPGPTPPTYEKWLNEQNNWIRAHPPYPD